MELKCNASFWTLFSCLPRFCSLLQKMSAKHPGDLINFRIFSEEIQKKTIRETDQEERRRIQLVQKEALSNGSCQSPNIADVIVITLLFKKPHTITNYIHTYVFFIAYTIVVLLRSFFSSRSPYYMNRLVCWLFERGVRRSCLVIIPSIFFVRRLFESKRQIVKSRLQSCTRRWGNVNGIFIWFCRTFCKLSLLTLLYFWEHMRHMQKLPGWLMDSLALALLLSC